MTSAMQELLSILDLERLEHNLFRGRSPQVGWQRVFGGQVISQALVAAQRTVNGGRYVHSLHCYFMLPGDPTVPIIYQVDRLRDGGSFTTRRVTAIQHGNAIFSLECSFHIEEEGLEHQMSMPLDVPPPEELKTQFELIESSGLDIPEAIRKFWARERPLEIKPVNLAHYVSREKLEPVQHVWVRMTGEVPDDRHLQAAILAYLSDMTLLDTSTFPMVDRVSTHRFRWRASTTPCGSTAATRSTTGFSTRQTAPTRSARVALHAGCSMPATAPSWPRRPRRAWCGCARSLRNRQFVDFA
jgi:acyl-CoA thioesterase II